MSRRTYGQYCGFARALELVGERWALLIVRDLFVGPQRFTDLRNGLPGIPTNILTARLKELEEAGLVRRSVSPRPGGSVVYELTEYGTELEDSVVALSRWGAKSLGEPGAGEIVTPESLVMALRTTFRPERARRKHVSYELHVGPTVIHAVVDVGKVDVGVGPLPRTDLTIEAGPGVRALMAGEISPAEALERRIVRITGNTALLDEFARTFRIDPKPLGEKVKR
jgi:DNA-binding HxlR family transcriptional regulator